MTLIGFEHRSRHGRLAYVRLFAGRFFLFGFSWGRFTDGLEAIGAYVGPLCIEMGWEWRS